MEHSPKLPRDDVNAPRSNLLRDVLLLVVGAGGALLLTVVVASAAIDQLIPYVPASWEARIFPRMLGPKGDQDAATKHGALLKRVLAEVAEHWPDNPYDIEIGVLPSEDVNALALPGGTILVTTGLLEATRSENELAFVLGHELGHFRNRDHLRGLGRGLVGQLLGSVVGGGGALDVLMMTEELASRSYSREQERDADAFGLQLVYAEYGHVAGAGDFFERIPDVGDGIEAHALEYMSTHPMSESRADGLSQLAIERGWPLRGRTVPLRVAAADE